MSRELKIYATAGDLYEALAMLPREAPLYTMMPPFSGVRLVPQSDGFFLVAPPPREDEAVVAQTRNR